MSQNGFLRKTPPTRQNDASDNNITLCRPPRCEKRQLPPVVDGLHVVAENLQPRESASEFPRRDRVLRTRRVFDERVVQQESARREQRRELREHFSFQKPRHVDEMPRPRERRESGGEVSLRANRGLDGHARLGRHLMPIE